MTKNQALRLALEYVELVPDDRYNADHIDRDALITAIKTTLEEKDEPAPVAKNEGGRITWMIDDWPQNCLLYTHPPQSFTYEQVKAHIRSASMSANDISVGSDTTEDGVSIVIRRRDELLYAEFFAYTQPQRTWIGLTDEHKEGLICMTDPNPEPYHLRELIDVVEFQLKEKNS